MFFKDIIIIIIIIIIKSLFKEQSPSWKSNCHLYSQ